MLLSVMPCSELPETTLRPYAPASPTRLPPPVLRIEMPSPALAMAAVPAAFVPIRLP